LHQRKLRPGIRLAIMQAHALLVASVRRYLYPYFYSSLRKHV